MIALVQTCLASKSTKGGSLSGLEAPARVVYQAAMGDTIAAMPLQSAAPSRGSFELQCPLSAAQGAERKGRNRTQGSRGFGAP